MYLFLLNCDRYAVSPSLTTRGQCFPLKKKQEIFFLSLLSAIKSLKM